MVPRTVLTRSGPISVNTARPVNTVKSRTTVNNAGPMKNVINNAYSTARRPFNKITATNNSNFTKKVNIVKGTRVNTARPKAVISAVKGYKRNTVKASACWVWRPKHKILDHGNPQEDLKNKGVIDSGCSRHMTGNKSYLIDYEEIDGGFVAFGDFKLTDESHVFLKVPRKDNMYSVDLKNVVSQRGLTYLFAKATPDESNLWHKRLGHVNFKIMNKLVRGNLVRGIENLIDLKVKVIRCDNGTEFKNRVMNQFCKMKGIKREFSIARTPQQNGVAERVLVIKPQNKTPYELFLGRKPALSFMRPFRCPVTILNTIDHLGKFDGKADEGFFVGYSANSKAFRVFNSRTRIVEENLHVQFSENTPNIIGSGPNWIFDIDALTNSMNYKPVVAVNQSNGNAGTKACNDAGKARMEIESPDAGFKPSGKEKKKDAEDPGNKSGNQTEWKDINVVDPKTSIKLLDDPNMPELEDIVYSDDDEDVGAEANMNNLDAFMPISLISTTRIHKDHPVEQIIGDLHSTPQTRRMTKNLEEHGLFSSV
ncbi:ribonuclease H-like domain-containing protein [Tanacetum coccineum]